ncbi:unnamed protein product [Adineta ricciae]|uniref:MULE transposase domain-containing protein n=1 Tax=Adineta ricciae TaxID=249248 RepID=A0A814ZPN0_ADIRI|nr:unnamed protein product [Adineta ricciae]CAF1529674.1 unnamed protein product [Adineta ricciae]
MVEKRNTEKWASYLKKVEDIKRRKFLGLCNFLQSNGTHNHLVAPEEIKIKQFRDALKERVINETTPISKVYDEEMIKAHFSLETLVDVPRFFNINSALNRARRKRTPLLPTCSSFGVPESYQFTNNGEKFLFCDVLVGRKKRMVLFGSPKQLEVLFDSSVVFMDGTFLATPPMFDQVFTTHGFKFEHHFSCVYGLLPDRKKSTYQQLFKELKNIATQTNRLFQPERIITDLESGLIAAIAVESPQAVHQGCYFHFNSCIYRRIPKLRYIDDGFFTSNESIETVEKLLQDVHAWLRNIKLKYHIGSSLPFLDVLLTNQKGVLHTAVYHKPSAEPFVVPFLSNHPRHVFPNIIQTAPVRAIRYSSTFDTFIKEQIAIELMLLYNGDPCTYNDKQFRKLFDNYISSTSLLAKIDDESHSANTKTISNRSTNCSINIINENDQQKEEEENELSKDSLAPAIFQKTKKKSISR